MKFMLCLQNFGGVPRLNTARYTGRLGKTYVCPSTWGAWGSAISRLSTWLFLPSSAGAFYTIQVLFSTKFLKQNTSPLGISLMLSWGVPRVILGEACGGLKVCGKRAYVGGSVMAQR
uniref:Uncharacterized protein n=1 Tax=Opuntia streptacantha TaxID=393608 RepID=A0A7C8YJ11_OPUST